MIMKDFIAETWHIKMDSIKHEFRNHISIIIHPQANQQTLNINRKRAAVIGILKQTIPLWHPYLRMSYGKLPFSFKYSESPKKDTMLQNILPTSPATP